MTLFKKNILILILITNYFAVQSQEGVWINEYTVNTESNQKKNIVSNRLMFKIEKDSLFTFDPGKEEWKGAFEMGFSYLKNGNVLKIPKVGIELEYTNDDKLIFKKQKEILHFRKIKYKKNNLEKFRKLISNNFFVSELTNHKKDTISFQFNKNSPKYSFKNVDFYLMELDRFNTLLFANFNGENLYEIDSFDKKGFSILENSKNGTKKIEFKIVKIKNPNKFLVKEEIIMLENE